MASSVLARSFGTLLVLATAVAVAACPGELDDPARFLNYDGGTSTSSDACMVETKIFQAQCGNSGCHNAVNPAAQLDLFSAGAASRVNGVAATSGSCAGKLLADPTDPTGSVLYAKTTTEFCGVAMMPVGGLMSSSDRECLRKWIAALTASSSSSGSGGNAGSGGSATGGSTASGGGGGGS